MSDTCAIWNTREIDPISGSRQFDSARAGGWYEITGTAVAVMDGFSPRQRASLTTWLMEQRRLGVQIPYVTRDDVFRARNASPMSLTSRRDGLLQAAFDKAAELGRSLVFREVSFHIPDSHSDKRDYLMAATESVTFDEVNTLINFATKQGLLESDRYSLNLTFDGYSRLEELKAKASNSSQGFVAMWFGPEVAKAYNDGIAPAIIDAGYKPMRIDQKDHNNKIDDEIIAEIRRSRFVVADFTCELVESSRGTVPIPRGGVYYEAGFAQGLGIPVIWCCHEDHINHVHFDTRQFNHITWNNHEDLRQKLRNRIGAVLGAGPLKPQS